MAPEAQAAGPVEEAEVLIAGTGFSGIGTAIQLQRAGIRDFLLLERAAAVGGVWRDNTYPGAACDIPSHLYCFSFEPNPDASRTYGRQPEIKSYLESLIDKHGLRDRIRFGAAVARSVWDDSEGRWAVECADGRRFRGRFQIIGAGPLRDPRWPEVKGLRDFKGALFHSSRWPEGGLEALAGKRVAVIGTGASAVQIVPEISKVAARLHVVQRTPAWVSPRIDTVYSTWAKWAFRHVPFVLQAHRFLIWLAHEIRYPMLFSDGKWRPVFARSIERQLREWIKMEVGDEGLAAALTPSYAPGCKRILSSSDFYPALRLPNVSLHTQAATEATPSSLVLADGTHLEVDAIICATGFVVDAPLAAVTIVGQGGVVLSEVWGARPRAYLGVTMPGFPNTFFVMGPNTGLGHNSMIVMAEAQIGYIVQAISEARARGPRAWVAPREGKLDGFVAECDSRHRGLVWASGCSSWYLNEAGENFSLYPGSTAEYIWRMRRFDSEAYIHGEAPGTGGGKVEEEAEAGAGEGTDAGRAAPQLVQRRRGVSPLL